jgi:hypothetical protein
VRYGLCAFFLHIPYSQVCAHEVHGWALESGEAGGIGANSSRGTGAAPLTYGQARHSCCSQPNATIGARALNLKCECQFTSSLSSTM